MCFFSERCVEVRFGIYELQITLGCWLWLLPCEGVLLYLGSQEGLPKLLRMILVMVAIPVGLEYVANKWQPKNRMYIGPDRREGTEYRHRTMRGSVGSAVKHLHTTQF